MINNILKIIYEYAHHKLIQIKNNKILINLINKILNNEIVECNKINKISIKKI